MTVYSRVIISALFLIFIGFLESFFLVTFAGPPDNGPDGVPPGGRFSIYFQNIVSGNSPYNGVCPANQVIVGFYTGANSDYGKPICQTVSAYWTLSGSQLFYTTGSIGVGTTNPGASLHVVGGQILSTTGFTTNSRSLTLLQNGNSQINYGAYPGSWRSSIQIQSNDNQRFLFLAPPEADFPNSIIRSANGGIRFDVGGTVGDNGISAVMINSSGNVGVGTSNPGYSLEVAGTGSFLGLRILSGASAGYFLTSDASGNAYWGVPTGFESALSLSGNLRGSVNILAKYTGTGASIGNSQIYDDGTNVGIGTNSPLSKLHVNGAAIIEGSINIGSNSIGYSPTSDSFTYSGYTYPNYGMGVNTSLIGLSGYYGIGLFTHQEERIRINSDGNIGIGTTNPTNTFQIGSNPNGWTGNNFLVSNGNGGVAIHNNSGSAYIFGSQRLDLYGNGLSTLSLSFGNVGIGTTSPGSKLDVNGTVRLSGDHAGSNRVEFVNTNGSGGHQWELYPTVNYFQLYNRTAAIQALAVLNNGNVGIGTTTPAGALDVNGSIFQRSSVGAGAQIGADNTGANRSYLVLDKDSADGIGVGGDYTYLAQEDTRAVLTSALGTPFDFGSNQERHMTIGTSGNVGIGTNNPTGKLTVRQLGSGWNDGIRLENPGGANIYQMFSDNNSNFLTLAANSDYTKAITLRASDGNVGIGTTSPADKLQVVGGYVSDKTGRLARNLLDTTSWTVGSGSVGSFSQADTSTENMRVWSLDPHGKRALVWYSPNGPGNADGGWNYTGIPIDNTKTYRSTVWIKKTGTLGGNFYLGADGANTNNLDGSQNTNPYFFAIPTTNIELNKWYLLVGYIHASTDTSTTSYGGVYDGVTGRKIIAGTDFKNRGDTTTQTHRTYNYYDADDGVSAQYFYAPRFEEIDGNEPSIEALLGIPIAATQDANAYFGGNVGIGTTSPSAKLQVGGGNATLHSVADGAILVKGTSSDRGLLEIHSPDGTSRTALQTLNSNGATYLNNLDGRNLVLQTIGGNVGIGTTSPSVKLDVYNGELRLSNATNGYMTSGHEASGYYAEQVGTNSNNENMRFQTSKSGNVTDYAQFNIDPNSGFSFMSIGSGNGNVGIGTSTPGSKLEVNGIVKAGGNYQNVVSWNYNGSPTNGVKIKTNIPFTNGSQMPLIKIEGYDYGNQQSIGIGLVWYVYSDNFTSYKASSWGASTPAIRLSNESGLVTIHLAWTPYYGRMTVSAYAQGMSEVASWFNGWTVVDEAAGVTNQVLVQYENSFPGTVNFAGGIWNSAGNVGIGTTSPSAKLFVSGSIRNTTNVNSTGDPGISLESGDRLGFDQSGVRSWSMKATGGNLNIYSGDNGGNTQINQGLLVTGNVGIGTFSPQKSLDVITPANSIVTVAGQILSVGQWAGLHFGYRENNNYYRKSAIVFERKDELGSGADGTIHILNDGTNDSSNADLSDARVSIRSNGNVGIGTTTPTHKLSIYDANEDGLQIDAASRAIQRFARAGVDKWGFLNNHAGTDYFGLFDYTRGEYSLIFKPNSDTYFPNGNVGIGTSSPSSKLEVAGSALVTGDLTVQGKVIVDTIVNRTVANVTISGSLLPDTAAPLAYRDIGNATTGRWNNLYLSGNASVAGSVTAGSFVGNGAGITGVSATSVAYTGITNRVDAPVLTTTLFGDGDFPVYTTSTTPSNIGSLYGPFSYAVGGYTCPSGTTKQYKLIAELVDNISSGGQNVAFRIDFDSGTDRDFNMSATWGSMLQYRVYDSGYFTETNGAHASLLLWINGTAGPYVHLRKVQLLTFCR